MELNTRCSEGYSSDVPKYLHNKPRPFVNHCRQRITSAAEVDPQHIRELCNGPEVGQFQVRSQSRYTWYNLSFGAGEVMPRCSCPDFCHTGLLCKHFFAIFEHYPKWQWDSLPEKYRENPHLSLDREHVFTDLTNCQRNEENHSILDQDITGNQQDDQAGVTNQKLKGTESQIRQEAIACREKIKGLSSLTYNIEDVLALKELKGSLEILRNKFTAFQKIDEKENSTQTPINKQSGKKQLETSFANYLPLPVRPKKKRFHNRAGEFASMMQKHYRVQIPVDGVSAKTSKTKSTLKRNKKPHNKPKHPSLPKKQCTEEPSYLIENEKKTCIDATAAQKRNNTTGPKISTCHDNNKNEEIMHATCVTNNQHLNSEDQPSAQEYRWTSSKLQSVLKQASKFKEEHQQQSGINSQQCSVSNSQQ